MKKNIYINDSIFQVLLQVLYNKYFTVSCFLGFIFGLGFSAINTHFTLYLFMDLQLARSIATWGFGFLHIGGILGRFGWGHLNVWLFHSCRKKGLIMINMFTLY